ncbi:8526_t:CDS:1, partial [Scutellospora calospora]
TLPLDEVWFRVLQLYILNLPFDLNMVLSLTAQPIDNFILKV